MKKLSSIASQFNNEELLSKVETAEVKGGRRFVTTSYAQAKSVISLLAMYGKTPVTNKHGDQYCIEW